MKKSITAWVLTDEYGTIQQYEQRPYNYTICIFETKKQAKYYRQKGNKIKKARIIII